VPSQDGGRKACGVKGVAVLVGLSWRLGLTKPRSDSKTDAYKIGNNNSSLKIDHMAKLTLMVVGPPAVIPAKAGTHASARVA
jgi:hypothetical protein